MSTAATEKSCNCIQIKQENPLGHTTVGFFSRKEPPFILNSCPQIPFLVGWGTREVQPSWAAYTILSPWTCHVQVQKFRLSGFCSRLCAGPFVYYPKVQESNCLGSVSNLRLEVGREIQTHFKDVHTHTLTHQSVCKNISEHFFLSWPIVHYLASTSPYYSVFLHFVLTHISPKTVYFKGFNSLSHGLTS